MVARPKRYLILRNVVDGIEEGACVPGDYDILTCRYGIFCDGAAAFSTPVVGVGCRPGTLSLRTCDIDLGAGYRLRDERCCGSSLQFAANVSQAEGVPLS